VNKRLSLSNRAPFERLCLFPFLVQVIKKWIRGQTDEEAVITMPEPILFDPVACCPQDGRKQFQLLVCWTYQSPAERKVFVKQVHAWSGRNGYRVTFFHNSHVFNFTNWKTGEVTQLENYTGGLFEIDFKKP
jgi:hypothetical protein